MATRVRVKGLDGFKLPKKIKTKIGRAVKKSEFEKDLVKEVQNEIRKNGIDPDITTTTVENRRKLSQYNSTHPSFVAGRSQLTFTGQLLNSLRAVFRVAKFSFTISANKRTRRALLTKTGKRVNLKNGQPTNAEVLAYQQSAGRNLAQIFKRTRFNRRIARLLQRAIRRNYKQE